MPHIRSAPLCWLAVLAALLPTGVNAEEPAKQLADFKAVVPAPLPASLKVVPTTVNLTGADHVQRLLVLGVAAGATDGRLVDYSRVASYTSSDPGILSVSRDGLLRPRGNGTVDVRALHAGQTVTARVMVTGHDVDPPVSFRNQIVPLFSKLGCNAGGCHGKATGQNGFKLSLLGFDADFDWTAVVVEARGRRVFPASPSNSLLLLKGIAAVPHGGGKRINRDSSEYDVMLRWIRQGAPRGSSADPHVVRVEVYPKALIAGRHAEQQLQVTAFYSDDSSRDVTREAHYKSNEPHIAAVDPEGLVRTLDSTGDTAVMARYMGYVDVCRFSIPLSDTDSPAHWPKLSRKNYVDELVAAKWRKLRLVPSPLADDSTFLRRASLDLIGTLPTPAEVRTFTADQSPTKREQLIDRLLARNEYADFWAVKWGDMLRNKRSGQKEHQRGTYAFHAWIRTAFATNMPYDQFVRHIVAAQGTVDQHPPVIWYRSVRNLTHQTNDTAQLFLGTRINCAQCHHHPYEKWSQDDYYSLQAFFARMGRKSGDIAQEPAIYVRGDGQVNNPASGKVMTPHGLDGPPLTIAPDDDPRHKLVDWMVQADNPFFARAVCNRYWGHFMGRGLVEPLDDMRVTNPPSNPELLDALAKDFVSHRFDLKHLIRTIMTSTAYQLSSDASPENLHDQQNYARAYPRRLLAEVLLDAICQVTGTEENFSGMPKGTHTIQLPDESVPSYFLDVFGRPGRETPCECERPREANLAQALQMLNSTDLQEKIGNSAGRLATLLKAKKSDGDIVEEVFLTAYGRVPRPDEAKTIKAYLGRHTEKKTALEDLLWVVLNSKEFLFNH